MVIPADPEEMRQFQAQCVAQCQCAVDISLPLAYILLPSKQAFQSIYNRCVDAQRPPPPMPLTCWHAGVFVIVLVLNAASEVMCNFLHPLVSLKRINNDLLMWEPPPPPPPSAHSPDHSRNRHDEFQLCKSAFRLGEFGI